ncbi:hypothetical protein [uncultured Ferrimonas sp.]|uniref:hypothetical protein n=1 Tax=uncultured Ferrimonas sp. TaxID=432640 RepID=UPI0026094E98|nr:hypothetical protein [uncultured Ferrimonas sp.]
MKNNASPTLLSKVSSNVEERLFGKSWSPTEEELTLGYSHVKRLVEGDAFSLPNISLYAQRVIAHLCVLAPSVRERVGNVFDFDGFWPRATVLFEQRVDVISYEVLLSNIDNLVSMDIDLDIIEIASDIILAVSTVARRSDTNARNRRVIKQVVTTYSNTKPDGLVKKRQQYLASKFSSFRKYSESEFDIGNSRWVNAFFDTYVEAGVVRNIQIFCAFDQYVSVLNKVPSCQSHEALDDGKAYIVIRFDQVIIVYSANGEKGYIFNAAKHSYPAHDLIAKLPMMKPNMGISLSRAGIWQYPVSYLLKKVTGFTPKRSEYMVNNG